MTVIGNYLYSGLPRIPTYNFNVWVSPDNGNDNNGQVQNQFAPFKTLNAAINAARPLVSGGNNPTIFIAASATNYINNGDVLLDFPAKIVGQECRATNNSVTFLDGTLTIDYATNYGTHIANLTFSNGSAADKANLDIKQCPNHCIRVDSCYFSHKVGNKLNVTTSGLAIPGTGFPMVSMDNCYFNGKMQLSQGTAGNPFNNTGMVLLTNCRIEGNQQYSYMNSIELNAGVLYIFNHNMCPPIIINGGAAFIYNTCFHSQTFDADNWMLRAENVGAAGDSYLFMEGVNMFSPFTPLTNDKKIYIGTNVRYSLKNILLKPSALTIDAGAIEYPNSLGFVNYNSMPVYRSGANIA